MSIWFGTFVIIVYQSMPRKWALEVITVPSEPCGRIADTAFLP